jgi:hypothetical protein
MLEIIKEGKANDFVAFYEWSISSNLTTDKYTYFFYKNRLKRKGVLIFLSNAFSYNIKFYFVYFFEMFMECPVWVGLKRG